MSKSEIFTKKILSETIFEKRDKRFEHVKLPQLFRLLFQLIQLQTVRTCEP